MEKIKVDKIEHVNKMIDALFVLRNSREMRVFYENERLSTKHNVYVVLVNEEDYKLSVVFSFNTETVSFHTREFFSYEFTGETEKMYFSYEEIKDIQLISDIFEWMHVARIEQGMCQEETSEFLEEQIKEKYLKKEEKRKDRIVIFDKKGEKEICSFNSEELKKDNTTKLLASNTPSLEEQINRSVSRLVKTFVECLNDFIDNIEKGVGRNEETD